MALAGAPVWRAELSEVVPYHTAVPDTKETREKKGRVKEQQRIEADIEEALEVAGTSPDPPLDEAEEDAIELSFEE